MPCGQSDKLCMSMKRSGSCCHVVVAIVSLLEKKSKQDQTAISTVHCDQSHEVTD